MRVYNLREGVAPDEDRLPARFHCDPIDTGRHAGHAIDAADFTRSIQQYYELAGWTHDGVPRDTTLVALGLEWAIPHLPPREHSRTDRTGASSCCG